MLTKTVTENSMESKIQKKPLKDKWLFEFKFILIVQAIVSIQKKFSPLLRELLSQMYLGLLDFR